MDSEAVDDVVVDMRHDTINNMVGGACPPGSYPEQWDIAGLRAKVDETFGIQPPFEEWLAEDQVEPELLEEKLSTLIDDMMEAKMTSSDTAIWRIVEKDVLLRQLDHHWKEHLATLDALRQVIWMRGIAQKQPINEYKQEAFGLFETMLDKLREEVTKILFRAELRIEPPQLQSLPDLPAFLTGHIDPLTGLDDTFDGDGSELRPHIFSALGGNPPVIDGDNPFANLEISRNAPCPCGSGNKYKHCHGAMSERQIV
jgi:preprotein translocase subunit SecA